MKIKKVIKKIHLWLGLTVGLIASFSGITGSFYVWQPEISALFAKKMLKIQDFQNIKYNDYIRTAQGLERIHLDSLKSIKFPERERQSIRLDFINGNSHYYHPANGNYLGKNPNIVTFFDTLLQLHRNLGIASFGKYIVGSSSIIFGFLVLGSGFYLWVNIYKKRWKKGFSFKTSLKRKVFNFNVHRIIGIYGMIPLFVIAITGGYFTYYLTYKDILNTIPGFEKKSNTSLQLPNVGASFDFNQTVLHLYPDYKAITIIYPSNNNQRYRYRFINLTEVQKGIRKPTDIFTTPDKVVTKVNSYENFSLSEKITAQMYPIHIGESFGTIYRIIVFFSGFLPLLLYITGIRFFLFRKKILSS